MQGAALAELGLAEEWEYGAVDLAPDRFEPGIRELARSGYVGVNVTVPHKEAALELADSASAPAQAIGAANTLSFEGEVITADNTDGPALREFLPETLDGGAGLVLGAGGAARAAIWALTEAGLEVALWNRTAARAALLAEETGSRAIESPSGGDFAVIINASAAGMGESDALEDLPLEAGSSFGPGQIVIDMVYGGGPGALIEAASAAGASTVDGIDVLVAQGALSLRIWTGLEPSRSVMEAAARDS